MTKTNPMRATAQNLPIILLVIAMLLLDAAAVVRVANLRAREASAVSQILIFSLAISQTCLLGMWAGLGRTRTVIRLPIAVAALAGWGQLICVLFARQNAHPWEFHDWDALHISLIAGFVAFVVGVDRMLGSTRLTRIGEPTDNVRIATTPRRFQFTLSEMLQVIAGCGSSLAAATFLCPPIVWPPSYVLGVHFAYAGMFVASGLMAAWAVLYTNFRVWRLGLLAAVTWAMLFAFAAVSDQPWLISEVRIGVWPYLAIVTGALFVCRVSGYRITNGRRERVAPASEVCECGCDATGQR